MIYRGIKSVMSKFRQMLLEDEYRVGKPYFTFNADDDPNDHLPGTWERLPDGVFIRNAGGDANPIVGQIQAEGLPDITGEARGVMFDQAGGCSASGAISISSAYRDRGWMGTSGTDAKGLKFKASDGEKKLDGTYKNDVYGKSDHVTPVNVALYMWRRTA